MVVVRTEKQLIYFLRWLNQQDTAAWPIKKKIEAACDFAGITQAELARRLGTTPSNLNQKVNRNTLTKEDMEKIAAVLGLSWRAEFILPGGLTI